MVENSTHRAIHRLVDRAAGAPISRQSLVRLTLTGVAAVNPRLDQAGARSRSVSFVDPNHHGTGLTFPGFVPGPPG
jgi:hypothetical protein